MPDDIIPLLREVLGWLRFQNRNALIERLRESLASDKDWEIYDLTDGSRSQDEIAKATGVSQPTVLRAWNRWRSAGIVVEVEDVKGRCRHLAPLTDLGVQAPTDKKGSKSGGE